MVTSDLPKAFLVNVKDSTKTKVAVVEYLNGPHYGDKQTLQWWQSASALCFARTEYLTNIWQMWKPPPIVCSRVLCRSLDNFTCTLMLWKDFRFTPSCSPKGPLRGMCVRMARHSVLAQIFSVTDWMQVGSCGKKKCNATHTVCPTVIAQLVFVAFLTSGSTSEQIYRILSAENL